MHAKLQVSEMCVALHLLNKYEVLGSSSSTKLPKKQRFTYLFNICLHVCLYMFVCECWYMHYGVLVDIRG